VYGVAMSEDCYNAEYIRVTKGKNLDEVRGSKYIQAKVGDTYKMVLEPDIIDHYGLS
jgi:hypothetical protein